MSEFVVPRRELCVFFIDHGTTPDAIKNYLEEQYNLNSFKGEFVLKSIQKLLLSKFNDRWSKSSRTKQRFLLNNSTWLESEFKVQFQEVPIDITPRASGERGRPPKSYDHLSEKSRKRKHMELVQEYGLEYIHNAYVQGLRSEGEFDEASVVEMMRKSDKKEKKIIKEKLLRETCNATCFTPDEALSLFADLDLSKAQYGLLRFGLNIDKPRQGTGNSNDGNTARRFFENYSCSSEITGVDKNLIKRFYIILQTLASGLAINPEKFGAYTRATAELYVTKYMWYNMPSSVHKILIHGESIIKHFAVLPIGHLSEDAQESRNKDYKNIRLNHARKCSRSATNEDVFNGLLFTSDPYISSIRKAPINIEKQLLDEAKSLVFM